MKQVIVSVTNDITTDQRVHKVCTSLTEMNFNVTVIGRKLKNSIPINRKYSTYRFKLLFNKGVLFYAEYNLKLFLKLLFTKKDILLANDLDTLLPNYLASKLFKTKLVYDSHELFTEVPELIDRTFVKNTWLRIEKFIVPKLKHNYTVCNSIANYYNSKYNTNFKTLRNLPFKTTNNLNGTFPFNTNNQKIILYQGALNKGRGLELMIETMKRIDNVIFVIIGSGDVEKQLVLQVKKLNLQEKVKFISKITPKALQKLTPLADLGLSIEEDLGLNYRFALPNKVFDYIQAQVPILVSDLIEMKQIVEQYNVGEIILDRSPTALANQITAMLQKGKSLYSKQLIKASNELIWEKESEKLIEIINNLE